MANVRETAEDILLRCKRATFGYEDFRNDEPLAEIFTEHLWTTELEHAGHKVRYEFYITNAFPGKICLNMGTIIDDIGLENIMLLAQFRCNTLTNYSIAAAIAAIVESYEESKGA